MKSNLLRKLQRTDSSEELYKALIDGLAEIQRQGVDRAILKIEECEPASDVTGRWSTFNESNYYPFETLTEGEKENILGEKHYAVTSLVADNVGGVVKYQSPGVEVYQRTRVHPFLPKLKPESNLNYVTQGGIWAVNGQAENSLREFAKLASEDGWTQEMVRERIPVAIQEYHAITRELMENAGVYKALGRIDQRQYTPFEKMLVDMRQNIATARKR